MASERPAPAPWARQKGEGQRAWEAFTTYRDAGASRNLVAVARTLGKSATLMARWSARWQWVSRAAAWDGEQDRIRREATARAEAAEAERWVKERAALRARELELGKALLEKAEQMLRFPLAQVTREEGSNITVIEPARWRMSDVPRIAETASRLIRLAAEMETDRSTVDINVRAEAEKLASELGISVDELLKDADRIAQGLEP